MLSKLLRRLILTQAVVGLLMGWLISRALTESSWLVAGTALGLGLAMPFLLLFLLTVSSVLRSRPPGGHAQPWRLVAGEYAASCRVFIARQPWAGAAPDLRPAQPGVEPRVPVLLLHGYLCNHRVWDNWVAPLTQAGHPVLRLDLEPLFTSIDQYAPLVQQAVDDLCAQTGAQKVALVGHSMGGLVIRAWMRAHGHQRVARVITLGTPHAGTLADRHPLTPNGKQMRLSSDWLHALAKDESPSTRQRMRLGLSPSDNVVYPQREQVLSGAQVRVFEGRGHVELCLDANVIQWAMQQLDDASSA